MAVNGKDDVFLSRCIDGVGKGESLGWKDRTTGLAQLPSGALHHINLMHSSVATNYKNRNLDFQKQVLSSSISFCSFFVCFFFLF